jgi:antitoxin VapB
MSSTMPSATTPVLVRVFTNGGSQAVTIPRQFRMKTKRATVSRRGDALIIRPARDSGSWDALWETLEPLDDSFRRWPTGPAEEREAL